MKLYVVVGSSGEYSDRRTWTVAALKDKTAAERYAFEALKAAKLIYALREAAEDDGGDGFLPYYTEVETRTHWPNPYDPSMWLQHSHNRIDYYVDEVDFVEAFNENLPVIEKVK